MVAGNWPSAVILHELEKPGEELVAAFSGVSAQLHGNRAM